MVSWVDHVIWWQVYPLGFLGAEKELGSVRGEVNRLPRVGGTVSLQTVSACWAQCPKRGNGPTALRVPSVPG
jgi:hypothetical protein